jgi:hypothetical protein
MITVINVSMKIKPKTVACPPPGGKFRVEATVWGTAIGKGGSFDVEVYDADPIRDDLLDDNKTNGVLPGPFKQKFVFSLDCDKNCHVKGAKGNSGEWNPEVYVWVNGGGNITAITPVQVIECRTAQVEAPSSAGAGRRKPARSKDRAARKARPR